MQRDTSGLGGRAAQPRVHQARLTAPVGAQTNVATRQTTSRCRQSDSRVDRYTQEYTLRLRVHKGHCEAASRVPTHPTTAYGPATSARPPRSPSICSVPAADNGSGRRERGGCSTHRRRKRESGWNFFVMRRWNAFMAFRSPADSIIVTRSPLLDWRAKTGGELKPLRLQLFNKRFSGFGLKN